MHRFVLFALVFSTIGVVITNGCSNFTFDLNQPQVEWNHYWEKCVGSGHASLALRYDWQNDLAIVHHDLGFKYVRFHAVLDDDMSVYQSKQSGPYYSYYNVDRVYDFLVSIGMKPVVELSFMPQDLAKDTTQTIFHYKAITSPPRDWSEWTALVKNFVEHLVTRYTLGEVSTWYFEVWNEPNCGFWSGTIQDYFYLLKITSQTIHAVNPSLKVGGPATCMCQYVAETMDYIKNGTISLDFISTHIYPTDFTPITTQTLKKEISLVRQIVGNMTLFYTEYNDGLYQPAYHDTPYASSFIIKNVVDVDGLVDLFSWWTFTDIFEEGGQESEPFNKTDGWGLLSLYSIPKPTYRAFQILHETGTKRLPGIPAPDFYPTVGSIATTNGTHLSVLLWNHNLPNGQISSESVCITVNGWSSSHTSTAHLRRIDEQHCNPLASWVDMGRPTYLTSQQILKLRSVSEFVVEEVSYSVSEKGQLGFEVDLPPQGVAEVLIPLPSYTWIRFM